MSKLDAQRAMREAKYARDRASGPTRREAAAGESGVPAQALLRAPPPAQLPDPPEQVRRPLRPRLQPTRRLSVVATGR